MNKVLLVGRLTRNPDVSVTASNIKYARFTIAVSRTFNDQQTDFVPMVVWRSTAEFVEKYFSKGLLVSVEGRFTSSTYQNSENQNVTRYEVTADRVEILESKSVREVRTTQEIVTPNQTKTTTTEFAFAKENEVEEDDVPWELDL